MKGEPTYMIRSLQQPDSDLLSACSSQRRQGMHLFRHTRSMLVVAASALLVACASATREPARPSAGAPDLTRSSPSVGTQFNGTYIGGINCNPMSGAGALQAGFSMAVSGNEVSYERQFLDRGRPTGLYERGSGTITPSGEIVLRGKGESKYRVDAEYRGPLTGDTIRLVGTQHWQLSGRNEQRSCQVDLTRSKP